MTLTVNGEKIEEKRIEQEIERLRGQYEQTFPDKPKAEREKQLREWSQENVIEMTLLMQQAKRRNEPVTNDEIQKAWDELAQQYQQRGGQDINQLSEENKKELRKNLETQLRFDKLLKDIASEAEETTEQQAKDFYQKNKEKFRTPLQIRAAHIVKHPDAQTSPQQATELIQQAKKEIDNGAMFEMVVGKYSSCPDNGGGLGYIKKGQMVKEFEDVVFNMGSGEVSDVFHTRFGAHIAKVYDRKESRIPDFEEVKEPIIKQLTEENRSNAINKFVDELKEKSDIKN
jgi:parvulin-like peptidyl-prolyl isomerase